MTHRPLTSLLSAIVYAILIGSAASLIALDTILGITCLIAAIACCATMSAISPRRRITEPTRPPTITTIADPTKIHHPILPVQTHRRPPFNPFQ